MAESLPGIKLTCADVASSFAGLRALVTAGEGSESPSQVPREEVILESSSGLITVAGGKLTTHREIAEKLIDRVMKELGRPAGKCPTLATALPGARPLGREEGARDAASIGRIGHDGIGYDAAEILKARYGTRAPIVARVAAERPELAAPLARGCPAIGAEVVHAVRNEMAHSIDDFLIRRTSLTWRYPLEAEAAAPAVARIMAAELGWDSPRAEQELASFKHEQARRRVPA
jgi:glycerol-3-phosphate dehydrogenase